MSIHFRKADEDGARIGEHVARDGLRRHFGRDQRVRATITSRVDGVSGPPSRSP